MTNPDVHRRRAIRFAVGAWPLQTLCLRLALDCKDHPILWALAWVWAALWCLWAASATIDED